MPWPLPALGTTGCAAHDLKMAAASCARRPAFAWPPVDDHRAWLPRVPEAALLREARKRRVTWLLHVPYSNIRSIYLEDTMTPAPGCIDRVRNGTRTFRRGMLLAVREQVGCQPEKRKVGGSTPPLTTSLETMYYASDQRVRRLPSMARRSARVTAAIRI